MDDLNSTRMNKKGHLKMSAEQWRKTPLVVQIGVAVMLEDIHDVAVHHREIAVMPAVLELLRNGRAQLESRLAARQVIYGVNTGFGANSNLVIPDDQLESHQNNLLTFLAAGTGDRISDEYVRAAQVMTLLALVRGWSAVRPEIAISLVAHINAGIVPNIPRYGSVGASGDLIPSSYLAGALCGRGQVRFDGQEMTADEALERTAIVPIRLRAKEGLALVNGTRMMAAVGTVTLLRFETTFAAAVGALALAVHALRASHEHYDPRIHLAKGHPGQIVIAAVLREMLACSPSTASSADRIQPEGNAYAVIRLAEGVQEIYSVRCAPQILGVVPESLEATRIVLEREVASANDNPLIDPETGDVLQGGNFMGQHVARAMDALKIDMALVANHLHAIMAILMDNRFSRGLPNSLSPRLGVCQGFKGVQISHTSLVAQIRHESGPASVHTLATEQFNQDIVSLGLHAAQGAAEIEVKLRNVVAMTLLAACQSVSLRGCADELAPTSRALYQAVRKISAAMDEDRPMDRDIAAMACAIVEGALPVPQIYLASDAH
jgi:histidine ammonia-lyase